MKMSTPLKAIRAKCLDCSADQPKEVRLCPITDCPLYPFRMGHNPNRKGIGGKPKLKTEFSGEISLCGCNPASNRQGQESLT